MPNQSAKVQQDRVEFYKDSVFGQMLSIIVLTLVLIVISLALYRSIVMRPATRYFKTDESGSVFQAVSLKDDLGFKDIDVTYWTSQKTASLFNINYINVVKQIESKSNLFDEIGWEKFKRLLVDQNLISPIVNKRQIMHGVPSGVPTVNSRGVLNGRYSWTIVVPIDVSYSGQSRFPTTKRFKFAVNIVRSSINQETPQGLAIHNIALINEVGKKT